MTDITVISQAQASIILATPQTITLLEQGPSATLLQVGAGLQGPPGPPGAPGAGAAAISTDPDNRLTTGTDNALFVPEITIDPLAYYILSRS